MVETTSAAHASPRPLVPGHESTFSIVHVSGVMVTVGLIKEIAFTQRTLSQALAHNWPKLGWLISEGRNVVREVGVQTACWKQG